MSAPVNNNDWVQSFGDGSRFRFNRVLGIFFAAFRDCGVFVYNATMSLLRVFLPDGALVLSYDAIGHHYLTQLPTGADYTVVLNGTTILITSTGQVNITSSQGINLISENGNIVIQSSAGITLTAQNGNITETASGAMTLQAQGGNATIQASSNIPLITGSFNDSVNNICTTYNEHVHTGVQTGSSATAPTQQTLS